MTSAKSSALPAYTMPLWQPLREQEAAQQPARPLRRALDMVRRTVRTHGLWQAGQTVLLACSGGRDSMALLALLRLLEPSLGHRTAVGHVDHGLQEGSAQWAALVQASAEAEGLPVQIAHLQLQRGPQLEARARQARYAALEQMANALGAAAIATAHHADDQAETFLLRASRGAGPDGLAGVRLRNGHVVRPVLGLSRDALHDATAELALPWVDDPSNALPFASRNRLRHEVLPALERALGGATAGLARTAALAAEQAGAAEAWLELALRDRTECGPGWLRVTVSDISAPARGTFWRWAASQVGAPPPGERAVQQLAALWKKSHGTAAVAGMQVQKMANVWQFVTSDVARPAGAD